MGCRDTVGIWWRPSSETYGPIWNALYVYYSTCLLSHLFLAGGREDRRAQGTGVRPLIHLARCENDNHIPFLPRCTFHSHCRASEVLDFFSFSAIYLKQFIVWCVKNWTRMFDHIFTIQNKWVNLSLNNVNLIHLLFRFLCLEHISVINQAYLL